ncbi:MAG: hypothetical protein K2N26_03550 [Oscillospiraceae bacterium]|nr:hypothetical protein [Oscillospiraceae bacterium]MDE7278784.1 hypothetical protein [Oscillospiraceae bacterium]
MKIIKMISILLAGSVTAAVLSIPSFADSDVYSSANNLKTVSSYSSEIEKEALIDEIKSQNPNALIFTSEDEKEAFFNELLNNYSVSFSEVPSFKSSYASSDEEIKNYSIGITTSLVNKINFYYSYGVRNTRFFTTLQGTPYMTYTGYTPGTTCSMASYRITKETSQCLDITFTAHVEYYLLVDNIVQLGAKDFPFHFKHDIAIGVYEA